MKSTEVILKVNLDNENVPDEIFWKTTSNPEQEFVKAKAFLLSIFEDQTRDTLKLDIWARDFQMNEMDRFMYHSLKAMCETYMKATNNKDLGNQFMNFVNYFGEKTEIISSSEGSSQ
jgi:gliding motility-associated protein GldC